MPVDHESCIDKLLDYIPDLMQRINEMFNKSIQQKEEKTKKIINEMKNRRMAYEEKEYEAKKQEEKSAEVKGQDEKIKENEKKSDYQETAKRLEVDGDIFE